MNKAQFLKRNPSVKFAIHALELARRNSTPIVYQVLDECFAG